MSSGVVVVHIEAEAAAAAAPATASDEEEDNEGGSEAVIKRSICWHSNTVPMSSIDSTIRVVFGLPDQARFMLLDQLGRVVVLDSSIPNDTTLTLKVLSSPPPPPPTQQQHLVLPEEPVARLVPRNNSASMLARDYDDNKNLNPPIEASVQKKRKQPMEYPPESYSSSTSAGRLMLPPPPKIPKSPAIENMQPGGPNYHRRGPSPLENSGRKPLGKGSPAENKLFKKLVANMNSIDFSGQNGTPEGIMSSDRCWKRFILPNSTKFPHKRWGHGFVNVYDQIFLYGGSSAEENFGDLWIFDHVKGSWSQVDLDIPPEFGRAWSSFTYVESLKSLVIIGGEDSDGICHPQVGVISIGLSS
eukprot:TRINITY_DN12076_c0_g1_i5.p1 TRINITY_DN12076_c0_g1~~TRINITY_DN12076_c0_g1_i5.p1  ORF type:complete len:358 (+),score=73.39 TRINITY_DN12076_c0_g1_i5:1643-2716(+)